MPSQSRWLHVNLPKKSTSSSRRHRRKEQRTSSTALKMFKRESAKVCFLILMAFNSSLIIFWSLQCAGEKGITIFAGDVYPIDIMCHLPAVCEEKDIMYCFTPSRQDLGVAMGVKRGSIALMIRENPDYAELYDELKGELKTLPHPF